jgi:CMP/dCMP kinase
VTLPMHIAISGEMGSGKTTVARLLVQDLGFRFVSTGDIHRSIAQRMNLSTLEANLLAERDDAIDDEVDGATREIEAQAIDPIIFDSRMAWHFLRRALRVRLLIDPQVAVARILGRGATIAEQYSSKSEASELVAARFDSERRRFVRRYGVDVARLRNFDLVIDASESSLEEVARVILEVYRGFEDRNVRVYVDATHILPTRLTATQDVHDRLPAVAYCRPHFFGLRSSAWPESTFGGQGLREVQLIAEGGEPVTATLTACDLKAVPMNKD